MRRAGRVLTGVDRVERAYLRAVIAAPEPAFGLIRAPWGYILVSSAGLTALASVLGGLGVAQQKLAWATARKHALARVPPFLLAWALRRFLPDQTGYLNVGHSNLTERVLSTVRQCGCQSAVMVHDVIPLDFPDFQREGSVPPFRDMLRRVARHSDLILYNSHDTQRRAEAHMPSPAPASIVAHLGTDLAPADPSGMPDVVPVDAPYFVCVGTVEPRKNHGFLLDLWDEMGADAPTLVIAGHRGWRNEDVFARLDACDPSGPVREIAGLEDGAMAALVERAAGVLFPSYAEGFGLPATDAVARGVPVVVNTLDVFREVLGDIPIYASVSDRYLWINTIKALAQTGQHTRHPRY